MNLFSTTPYPNLLPFDGEVHYYPHLINKQNSSYYLKTLLNKIAWQKDRIQMYGKTIVTNREIALYGDSNFVYGYAKNVRVALPWTPELSTLKHLVEEKCIFNFNACLLNLYNDGNEGLGWHADDEKELGTTPTIASLTFGADRKFMFKHRETKQTITVVLEKGSLLVMKGQTQKYWLHKLPPTSLVKSPRINLTFRNVIS